MQSVQMQVIGVLCLVGGMLLPWGLSEISKHLAWKREQKRKP